MFDAHRAQRGGRPAADTRTRNADRVRHVNRIKVLLAIQGVFVFEPIRTPLRGK